MDEVLQVLETRFGDHPGISEALECLHHLLGSFELVPRSVYAGGEGLLESRVRDRKDIPVLACAIGAHADYLVSGDKDLLVLGTADRTPTRKTRDVLAMIEQDR